MQKKTIFYCTTTVFSTNSCSHVVCCKATIFWHKFMFLYIMLSTSAQTHIHSSFVVKFCSIFSTNLCLFIFCCKILHQFFFSWHKFAFLYLLQSKLEYLLLSNFSIQDKFMFLCLLLSNFSIWHTFVFLYLLLSNSPVSLAQTHATWKKPTKSRRCQYGPVA